MLTAQSFLERRQLLLQGPHFEHFLDGHLDLGRSKGFGDVVRGAAAHGHDRGVDGRVGGNDDHFKPGDRREQRRDEVEAVLCAEPQVDKGQVERRPGRLGQGVTGVADGADPVSFCFETEGQGLANIGLVIDDEDLE